MKAYYNENDPKTAAWLRQLVADGVIEDGVVDDRSIVEVSGHDLAGTLRADFFAGIGCWSEALRIAGWPKGRQAWSGSCPCQSYSNAGKRAGNDDHRNLWPEFFRIIRECHPATIFGEQVEAAIRFGWIDRVQRDLEGEGYAFGFAVLGAHSVGSPHIRQRIYWVANSDCGGRGTSGVARDVDGVPRTTAVERVQAEERGSHGGLANARRLIPGFECRAGDTETTGERLHTSGCGSDDGWMEHSTSNGREQRRPKSSGWGTASGCGDGGMGHADEPGLEGRGLSGCGSGNERIVGSASGPLADFWGDSVWIPCKDGKQRRIKRGLQPLVDGSAERMVRGGDQSGPINTEATAEARVMRLRGYGNAIVPQLAAEFIRAFMDVVEIQPDR